MTISFETWHTLNLTWTAYFANFLNYQPRHYVCKALKGSVLKCYFRSSLFDWKFTNPLSSHITYWLYFVHFNWIRSHGISQDIACYLIVIYSVAFEAFHFVLYILHPPCRYIWNTGICHLASIHLAAVNVKVVLNEEYLSRILIILSVTVLHSQDHNL